VVRQEKAAEKKSTHSTSVTPLQITRIRPRPKAWSVTSRTAKSRLEISAEVARQALLRRQAPIRPFKA
jgi:hypothetical protein